MGWPRERGAKNMCYPRTVTFKVLNPSKVFSRDMALPKIWPWEQPLTGRFDTLVTG